MSLSHNSMFNLGTNTSTIKSIQRGLVSMGIGTSITNVTISPVNMAKAFLTIESTPFLANNPYIQYSSVVGEIQPMAELTSSTNIKFTCSALAYTSGVNILTPQRSLLVAWQLIEFN